jgi:hypothetical protein
MFLKDPFITIILSTPSALPDKLRPEDGGSKFPKTVESTYKPSRHNPEDQHHHSVKNTRSP